MKGYELFIKDMECAGCVSKIEKALEKLDSKAHIKADIARHTVWIDVISPEKAIKVIKKAGFSPTLNETVKDGDWELVRLVICISLLVPLVVLSIGIVDMPRSSIVQAMFATFIVVIGGLGFFSKAFTLATKFQTSMDTLVSISVSAALVYSFYSMFFGGHVYFETAGFILTIILFGKYIEDRAKKRATLSLRSLLSLRPDRAIKIEHDSTMVEMTIEFLKKGDIVIVKPGSVVPADGIIIKGQSEVDESMVAGESIAVAKKKGDTVLAGTINQLGPLNVEVEKIKGEMFLDHIIYKVKEALGSKVPMQRLADQVSSVFIPVVILIALTTFSMSMVFGVGVEGALIRAMSVLLIACPCALGLATPISIVVGALKGIQKGILFQDGKSLEYACKIEKLFLDKTGTLTMGSPSIHKIIQANGIDRNTLISLAACVESKFEHPLAKAIIAVANEHKIDVTCNVKEVEYIVGQGVKAKLEDGDELIVGSEGLVERLGMRVPKELSISLNESKSLVIIAKNKAIMGAFEVEDSLKTSAKGMVEGLKELGIELCIISGDRQKPLETTALALGIKEAYFGLSPEEKIRKIEEARKKRLVVGMVGDGINDAPALAKADVSFAIQKGTDIARQVASVVLIHGGLEKVKEAILISKKTLSTIKQNLFFAFFYNSLGIPLAAFGFLNPMLAALAMALSDLCVVGNALRLKRAKV